MYDTIELHLLDLRPSVPRRVVRTSRWRRLLNSPAAAHVRAAVRSTFWPAVVGSSVLLAFVLLTYLQAVAPSVPIR